MWFLLNSLWRTTRKDVQLFADREEINTTDFLFQMVKILDFWWRKSSGVEP